MGIGELGRRGVAAAKRHAGPVVAARQPTRADLPWAQWGLGVLPGGMLGLDAVDLDGLARRAGTPLHVVDLDGLGRAADDAMAPWRAGTGADVLYSYKTNPVPGVLARLHRHGIGAEVISAYELWLALRLGVDPARIVYNGPSKSDDSLRTAVRRGVLVNANSAGELDRLAGIAAEERCTARVGIRVAVPGAWGGQFGIPAGSPALHAAVRVAQATTALELCGLHAHRGGTIRSAGEWQRHVDAVLAAAGELHLATGWIPTVLDLGGRLACPTSTAAPQRQYRLHRALGTDLLPPDPADAISVAAASEQASGAVRRWFADRGLPAPTVLLEPGRALTGSTQLLLTSVVDVKDDVDPPHAVLDAGTNLTDPLPHEYHQLFSVTAPGAPAGRSYRLVGPICTPGDVLYWHWRLPELEPGHVLAVMDTGAYFVPFSTSFSFPQPGIVGIEGGEVVVLRRPETFDDLVMRDGLHGAPAGVPQHEAVPAEQQA